MKRLSGQMGVPIIVAGDEVIVGFDRPRLERLAQRYAARPRLGVRVKDAPGGGVEVGAVHPGTLADRAGVRSGDVVLGIDGAPARTAADLEGLAARLRPGATHELLVRRGGREIRLPLTA